MKRIAILFAGQGAQTVGMGKDLVSKYPTAAALFNEADSILGRSLSSVAFDGPETDLVQTANCQPALYVHGLACLALLLACSTASRATHRDLCSAALMTGLAKLPEAPSFIT